ncbi:hypothetical protein J1N35_025436 [Gossypium stocksii]|uniref:RNase H type-1 domain-containing protein n=1 Tax=Gossypium stocksii TaxID=47602 RepID=A0A9D3V901_9ROSI|nr:hypothetical protein J1N35_025436 [Gossypium stocksii]
MLEGFQTSAQSCNGCSSLSSDHSPKLATTRNGMGMCNIHAAFFYEDKTSYVVVFHDSSGRFLQALSGFYPSVMQTHVFKPIAVGEALLWMKDQGQDNVIVELDCLEVVNALN